MSNYLHKKKITNLLLLDNDCYSVLLRPAIWRAYSWAKASYLTLSIIILTSCDKTMPTGFWKDYKEKLIKVDISDQGPWGGHRAMYWRGKGENEFIKQDIIDFATENGWTFVEEFKFNKTNLDSWTYDNKKIFPLDHEGFNPALRKINETHLYFPRWINGGIELLKFKTDWITVTPGSGESYDAFGYVLLNVDKSEMSVYHLWGE